MTKDSYRVIGVMSGTSLDGIDMAQLTFTFASGKWHFTIGNAQTVAYPEDWVNRLRNAVNLDLKSIATLDGSYTKLLSSAISKFISDNNLTDIDAICSHGHTVLHQPQNGITIQIGNRPEIALLTNQKIVCDFRVQDVEMGGQGAPLVPIGDRLLFADYNYCLNLGGFSNVSFEDNDRRIAFDISPVNTMLNKYANLVGKDYDDKGQIASVGNIIPELIEKLNSLPYYKTTWPKSLGMEFVNAEIFPLTDHYSADIPDLLHTFCEHIAIQTESALPKKTGKMLITGGGAYHDFLIDRIKHHLPQMEIVIPDKKLLEFKEALIFGLLGILKLRNQNNVLASVTGASQDHSSGRIFLPYD
ncbi:anhydro-N-acetylmuramic acid kinase [Flavobacterium silvaticum]|uniref:Anhydro-N-acetylmuramic acid kinase n=1 Tax=Flavobacterium silvaticum TaxID=1852020 RepID=A0A972FP61_9FLAO|nr:anhydro-N-acetylmuramic acid kinase [Flavobacterium silvaticum]NMH29656.1 anhydro-N-acetylmuramic acid kinase [Flavobacterium silvaticum]